MQSGDAGFFEVGSPHPLFRGTGLEAVLQEPEGPVYGLFDGCATETLSREANEPRKSEINLNSARSLIICGPILVL